MRLIDADALADALYDKRKNYPQWVADVIGEMPTIDTDAMLKEQDAVHWTKCSEKLPSTDGDYLVVKSIMGIYDKIDVCKFTLNLHNLDEFDFPDEDRPGWCECDSETGYYEWTGIKYWSELPKMPDADRR